MLSIAIRVLSIAVAAVPLLLSILLLLVCTTNEGAGFGVSGMLLSLAPMLACFAWERKSKRLWAAAATAVVSWTVITFWLTINAPNGQASSSAKVQHHFAHKSGAFRHHALGNLLPEVDQFMLGFRLVPAVDPYFTMAQSKKLSRLTASIYQELEADNDFHALGSMMPEAYNELWGRRFDHGHYFLYVPERLDRHQPQPTLVFLHGSGGNFKAYTWLLSKVADDLGMILIAPSYGMGNWHEPDTSRVVQAALDDAAKVIAIAPRQMHLIGLSNGGLGVSQAGSSLGDTFQSLTFLSPVFDGSAVGSPEFVQHWKGRPVLVISGRADERVPFAYVAETVSTMISEGITVTLKSIDGADHFMMFSHGNEVIGMISTWLRAQPSPK